MDKGLQLESAKFPLPYLLSSFQLSVLGHIKTELPTKATTLAEAVQCVMKKKRKCKLLKDFLCSFLTESLMQRMKYERWS